MATTLTTPLKNRIKSLFCCRIVRFLYYKVLMTLFIKRCLFMGRQRCSFQLKGIYLVRRSECERNHRLTVNILLLDDSGREDFSWLFMMIKYQDLGLLGGRKCIFLLYIKKSTATFIYITSNGRKSLQHVKSVKLMLSKQFSWQPKLQ